MMVIRHNISLCKETSTEAKALLASWMGKRYLFVCLSIYFFFYLFTYLSNYLFFFKTYYQLHLHRVPLSFFFQREDAFFSLWEEEGLSWVALWHCSTVTLWRCGIVVALWHCGLWHSGLWHSGTVALWHCGTVALWLCGSVTLWGGFGIHGFFIFFFCAFIV